MLSKFLRLFAAAGLIAALMTGSAALSAAEAFSNDETKSIENIVKDYIAKNPEIIGDAFLELQRRQVTEQEAQQSQAIAKNADALFRSSYDYVAGNAKGDVTVVEFFDYNCPFCRRAFNDIVKLIKTDSKVRVVFKELPLLGKPSEDSARLAIAAIPQGKYFEFHAELLKIKGRVTKSVALKVAKKLGMDVEKLEKDMNDPKVDAALAANRTVADKIGLQGTPLYLIGDQIIPGAPEDLYDQLVARVNEVRTKGCQIAVC